MKNLVLIFSIVLFTCTKSNAQNYRNFYKIEPAHALSIELKGYVGSKIDLCIEERIKKQDVDHLIEPFKYKTETRFWQSEFWGKWMIGAVGAYKYTHDQELFSMMKNSVEKIVATQLPNGYIGNYPPENQLTNWDIWGRKYSMLGLIKFYEISGDKKSLNAAKKVADHLISQVGVDKTNIIKTGNYRGMASSSVLEPIVYLYNHTGQTRYLDFAKYIVGQWETTEGPQLIDKALDGILVSERFPQPNVWWSWENGQKAYEMMSCYDGLLQLYLVTKNSKFLKAVEKTVENIIETEINIAGSGSAFECWYKGIENQTRPTYHNMETCVTTTWMKINYNLLKITANPKYADQIEKTFYNALLGAMKYDAEEIAKYTPLEGIRQAGEEQCGMHINCCNANGPRGFVQIPEFAIMNSADGIYINFYGEMIAQIDLQSENSLTINQKTTYPEDDKIVINIDPENEAEFAVNLRIPEWSQENKLFINGIEDKNIKSGTYKSISRLWKKGDEIELVLDLRARIIEQGNHQAIEKGPIVLARDNRLDNGFVDEAAIIQSNGGFVKLIPVKEKPDHIWMAFTAPLLTGTDLEGEFKKPQRIKFCDFSSAGNTWEKTNRYKVWIRKTLNVMKRDYKGY